MAKILVVDDEKVMVKGIRFNLENEGYTVDVGYNGRQAVDLARANDYDLIILDLMMPEVDGLEACMEIRSFSSVPIIMLTARSQDTDKLLGFEYGADDYITKPFNILEVKARVKALLRRSAATKRQQEQDKRLTSGGLTIDPDARAAWRGKADQLRLYSGPKYQLLSSALPGTVCAVTGLDSSYAGEGLGFEPDAASPTLEPVLGYHVLLPSGCDVTAALRQLRELEQEDPLLHVVWDERLGEVQLQLRGEVQLEVLPSL